MAKQKKKRNKKYTGAEAAVTRPVITRVTAVSRSKTRQWLYERRKFLKTIGIGLLILAAAVVIISGILSLFH